MHQFLGSRLGAVALFAGTLAGCASSNDGGASDDPAAQAGSSNVTHVSMGGSSSESMTDAAMESAEQSKSGDGGGSPSTTDGGAGSSQGGSGGAGGGPPTTIAACDGLAAAGKWDDITPPDVKKQLPGPGSCTFGSGSFVLDWSTAGTVYLGTCNMGIWKSTDCGTTWAHLNTGKNGTALDQGRQWTFSIDPVDPKILYTNSGYGAQSNGAYRSANGGVDWEQIWPPSDPALANVVQYNFVQLMALDPNDRRHLLLSFHSPCLPPHSSTCMAESKDSGATWRVVEGNPSWSVAEAQYIYFLDDSQTWLWALGSNGLWRTTDSGAHWSVVEANAGGHNFAPVYRAQGGAFYLSLNTGLYRSPDGVAWLRVVSDPMIGVIGNGKTLFVSRGFPWNPGQGPAPYEPFRTSAETDGKQWSQMSSPKLANGGTLAYDAAHHILYSSNLEAGFWRVVTPQ